MHKICFIVHRDTQIIASVELLLFKDEVLDVEYINLEKYDVIGTDMSSMEEFVERYPHDITDGAHFYRDDQVVCDEELQHEIQLEQTRTKLRSQRKQKCFPIVNRGVCWYNDLSDQQKEELQNWYHAWLDVTDTLVVPETPSWIPLEEVSSDAGYYHL
jgi:hypothetical protein